MLLDYPTIGGENIKDYVKKAIGNILHVNIDVHSRSLIAEFPVDGVNCISKLQSHCANMTLSEKLYMIGFYSKLYIKEGSRQ